MAKYYDVIGYAIQAETVPGVWTDTIIERRYRGDVLQNYNRWQTSDKVNDDLVLNNRLSIIADPFAYSNLTHIKYVKWNGNYWKISNVDIQRPRLIMTIGGVYNGPTATPPTP